VRTSRTVCRVSPSCSRPVSPRAWPRSARSPAGSRSRRPRRPEDRRHPDDGAEEVPYQVPMRSRLLVADGESRRGRPAAHRRRGEPARGAAHPRPARGAAAPGAEVQEVYRSQGVSIHDKHIEIIIRQMLKRVNVLESGDTDLLPGELVERPKFEEVNRAWCRGRHPGLWPSGADGYHQGVAGHRVVAVGGLLPGDHPGAHRRGDPRQVGLAARPQGERDHRQAHPGRHRHAGVPEHPGRAHRRRPCGHQGNLLPGAACARTHFSVNRRTGSLGNLCRPTR
jgi:hypothetical protein